MSISKKQLSRNWGRSLYPESLSDNWRDILNEEYAPWLESPLHDKDINADGELKKSIITLWFNIQGKKFETDIRVNDPI